MSPVLFQPVLVISVTLVRPAEDEATLKKLSQVPVSSLRPEFQRGLANLKDKVYAQTRAKSVNGRALSGAMLATLAKTYADAFNEALESGGQESVLSLKRAIKDLTKQNQDLKQDNLTLIKTIEKYKSREKNRMDEVEQQ